MSIQAQIISLLKRLCKEHGAAVMLVTHDMGVIAETCDRVAVMYAGRIVEIGPVHEVIHAPAHPYTAGLMGSIPAMDEDRAAPAADRRRDAAAERDPARLRLQSALPARLRPLPRRAARSAAGRRDAGRLLAARGAAAGRGMSAAAAASAPALVEVDGLAKTFDVSPPWLNRVVERKPRQFVHAVDDVSFAHRSAATTLALVGESGCGKSTVARLLVGLYAPTRGRIVFDGVDATRRRRAAEASMRRRMQMIFQDPYASLNPRWKVRDIVAEPLREHGFGDERPTRPTAATARRRRASASCSRSVGLAAADAEKFPHQFSGGQRQRISIARALATEPEFLVCDEPTSALDVSVQAQVLNIMKDLQREQGLTYLFISHNLAVVRHVSDQVGVMYLGRIVELADKAALFAAPRHPYTRMLLDAIPDIHMSGRARTPVQGEVPNPLHPPSGCTFHPRCPHANERCRVERPELLGIGGAPRRLPRGRGRPDLSDARRVGRRGRQEVLAAHQVGRRLALADEPGRSRRRPSPRRARPRVL